MRTVFTGAARAALVLATCRAFYLPGVAPRTFRYGDKVELKVNKLTSVHTQIPYDYYSLKFCRPRGGIKQATENLGECARGVPWCLHFLGWTRGHLTSMRVVSFLLKGPFGPRRATAFMKMASSRDSAAATPSS